MDRDVALSGSPLDARRHDAEQEEEVPHLREPSQRQVSTQTVPECKPHAFFFASLTFYFRTFCNRVGAGKFCSISCSKRVGARARWSGYKRASDKRGNDKRGKGAGSSRRAPPPPPPLPIVPLVGPEDAAEDGLRGEHVVATVQTAKAASVRVRGVVKEYSDRSDKHWCVLFRFVSQTCATAEHLTCLYWGLQCR